MKRSARPLIPAKVPNVRRARARLQVAIADFLKRQAPKIAGQVVVLRGMHLAKADDLTPDEEATIERIIAGIDFTGWAVLAGDVDPILAEIGDSAGMAALAHVGIDVESRQEVANVVSTDALTYARERSAEMVGRRFDELGRLVDNPNAEWTIDAATRDFLRGAVADAIAQGTPNAELAQAIQSAYAFSEARAETIARTETNLASNNGALSGYKASGVVDGKQWLTADDDLVSEECQANGEAGPNGDGVLFDLDAVYPSGDAAPPVHPNCRCAIAPFIQLSNTEPAQADTELTA